jgi:hypothetical protein
VGRPQVALMSSAHQLLGIYRIVVSANNARATKSKLRFFFDWMENGGD